MSQVLYLAITSHGFGHAVRLASIVAAIQRLNPEIVPIMATTAPHWLLDSYLAEGYIQRPRAFDVGVIQSDSLHMDKTATLGKWQEISSQAEHLIASEVDFLKVNRVGLILGDIPPLAPLMAKKAGIPCWLLGNFGWDFIYQAWGPEFASLSQWIRECYGQCDRLFRLPLCAPMDAFPNITDVGLTGGHPRYDLVTLRDRFHLDAPHEKTILLSFGGLGLDKIPYHNLRYFPDWQFITFDSQAPQLPNLLSITDRNYRPVDFMPLCDRVLSKPGYSTFAEALRLDVPLVSLIRDDFAEGPILLEGLRDYAHHQIISVAEFFQGNWGFLRHPLQPPRTTIKLPKDGCEAIAQAVVEYFGTQV
jgi:hypothetical protein